MKLNYEDWVAIKDRTKKELKPLVGTGKEPNMKFADKSFSWDYHYIYPPGVVRLHYTWENGEVAGWRTPHWSEGLGMPERITMDDEYLLRVFDVSRL